MKNKGNVSFFVLLFFCFFVIIYGCGEIQEGQETNASADTDLFFAAENIIEEDILVQEFTVLSLNETIETDAVQVPTTSIKFELYSEGVIGDEFTVSVVINNAEDLFGAPFRVMYDGLMLSVVSVEAGGFLGKSGETAFMYALGSDPAEDNPEKTIYQIIAGYTRLGKIGGVSGDGTLAKIKFKILAKGETKLSFERINFQHYDLSVIPVRYQSMTLKIE